MTIITGQGVVSATMTPSGISVTQRRGSSQVGEGKSQQLQSLSSVYRKQQFLAAAYFTYDHKIGGQDHSTHDMTTAQRGQLSHSTEGAPHRDSPGRAAEETLTHRRKHCLALGSNTPLMQSRHQSLRVRCASLTEGFCWIPVRHNKLCQPLQPWSPVKDAWQGALCSVSCTGSEQRDTQLVNKGSTGACHPVAGGEDVQRDTKSKQSEDREHTALAHLKRKLQSSKNPHFSPYLVVNRHHVT